MREIVLQILEAGIEGADPRSLLSRFVDGSKIRLPGDLTYDPSDYEKVVLIGVGKACEKMAEAFQDWEFDQDLLITDNRAPEKSSKFTLRRCSHPLPSQENLDASEEALSILDGCENALIIVLISGGGSSLFCLPPQGITLDDVIHLNRILLSTGVDIHEMNTVRKHISRVKGGRFAEYGEKKGTMVSFILSDVVGDELSDIASGPTVGDDTTFQDAISVLKRHDLWEKTPVSIRDHLKKGRNGEIEDTPSEVNVQNVLIGGNRNALEAASEKAAYLGIRPMILTSTNQGEAKEVAKLAAAVVKECQDYEDPVRPPVVFLIGGEMTTGLPDDFEGYNGGPNREFVLSFAISIKDRSNIAAAAVDTDGVDGKGKAGAFADCGTVVESEHDAHSMLSQHRTQEFFDGSGGSLEFPVKTNVNDLIVIFVQK